MPDIQNPPGLKSYSPGIKILVATNVGFVHVFTAHAAIDPTVPVPGVEGVAEDDSCIMLGLGPEHPADMPPERLKHFKPVPMTMPGLTIGHLEQARATGELRFDGSPPPATPHHAPPRLQ